MAQSRGGEVDDARGYLDRLLGGAAMAHRGGEAGHEAALPECSTLTAPGANASIDQNERDVS